MSDKKSTSEHKRSSLITYLPILSVIILIIIFNSTLVAQGEYKLDTFFTIFLSIFLEALPFLLLGTLLSSAIEILVSKDFFERMLPKNPYLGIIVASFMGIFMPICECAIVPLTGRLVKKGVPLYIATTLLLSVPILNPLVLLSTYYAFRTSLSMLFLRVIGGVIIANIIGILTMIFFRKKGAEMLLNKENPFEIHNHSHDHSKENKLSAILDHTFEEFFDVGKYFIMGALLSAAFQTYLPRSILYGVGATPILSVLIMVLVAFVLSVCSEADAFIARSYMGQFSYGSILSFLTLGPMIDIKNTLMLAGRFKRGYVLFLMASIFILNIAFGIIVNYLI
ncbi:permease [Spirochaeta cellobiosiphila]|uniref:permease n=1 Tax=Spirochaeta cellobiosiphila TaxID=504483 RepID=UPI00041C370A|nr:permease [Spirochaeta cellobiosiphila]